MGIQFPPIILQSCTFCIFCNIIYLLVLAWQSIIKLKLKLSAHSIIPAIVNPYSVFISTSLTSYSLVRCLKLDWPVSICFKPDPHFAATRRELLRSCFTAESSQRFTVAASAVTNFNKLTLSFFWGARFYVSKIEEFEFQFNRMSHIDVYVPCALNGVLKISRVPRTGKIARQCFELDSIIFV